MKQQLFHHWPKCSKAHFDMMWSSAENVTFVVVFVGVARVMSAFFPHLSLSFPLGSHPHSNDFTCVLLLKWRGNWWCDVLLQSAETSERAKMKYEKSGNPFLYTSFLVIMRSHKSSGSDFYPCITRSSQRTLNCYCGARPGVGDRDRAHNHTRGEKYQQTQTKKDGKCNRAP